MYFLLLHMFLAKTKFNFDIMNEIKSLRHKEGRNCLYSCRLSLYSIVEPDGNNEIVILRMFPSESAELPSYFHFTSDTYRSATESSFETP